MSDSARSRGPGRPHGAPETIDQSLQAAGRLFAASGFAGTVLREIAAEAGVTTATLIYHFGSKEKLYGRVLERVAASIAPYVPLSGSDTGGGGEDTCDAASLADMVERFLDWGLDHRPYAALLLRELMENPDRARRARRWYLTPLIDGYATAIRCGQARGTIAPCDPEMFAFYVTGAITHFCVSTVTIQRMLALPDEAAAVARFRGVLRTDTLASLTPGPT